MQQPKLLRELKNLSSEELSRFQDYVHSPFFNKHWPTTQLFDFIHEQIQNIVYLDKKKIFKIIYGKDTYKEYKINNLMSYLMALLEDFHGLCIWEGKKRDQQLNQLEYCYQKNRTELFKTQQLRLGKKLKRSEVQDSLHFYQQHRYFLLKDYFSLQQGERKYTDFLQKQVRAFDIYYISEKLKFSCDLISRMKAMNKEYELEFLPELLSYLKHNWAKYDSIPSIEIYHCILMTLLESEKEAHYDMLNALLRKYRNNFSAEEAQLLYDYAQNYCIEKINDGDTNYLQALFKLFQQLIDSKLILKNALISEWDYKNVVTVGCRLGAFEWTKDFIENYKDYLPESIKENAYTFNLVTFYYSTNQNESALGLLQKINFTDIHYHLGAKFIQCKIYFEAGEDEALLSLLDSFRIYLLRSKGITKKEQQAQLNFIRFIKKLTRLKETKPLINEEKFRLKIKKLEQNLLQTNALVNKEWLLQQLGVLYNKV